MLQFIYVFNKLRILVIEMRWPIFRLCEYARWAVPDEWRVFLFCFFYHFISNKLFCCYIPYKFDSPVLDQLTIFRLVLLRCVLNNFYKSQLSNQKSAVSLLCPLDYLHHQCIFDHQRVHLKCNETLFSANRSGCSSGLILTESSG